MYYATVPHCAKQLVVFPVRNARLNPRLPSACRPTFPPTTLNGPPDGSKDRLIFVFAVVR